MNKIIITSERKFKDSNIIVGYLEENKVEKLQFEFPKEYKDYGKRACFETADSKFSLIFDDATGDTLTLTREITQFSELDMSIMFYKIENDDEIIARTSVLHISIKNSIVCDDDITRSEPRVIILDDLIEKVNNLDVDLQDNILTITRKDGTQKSTNVKGERGEPGKFKIHIVEQLPTIGEDGAMYLIKKETTSQEDLYNEYIYADGEWNLIGNTHIDLSDYYTKDEVDDLLYDKKAGVELFGTFEDGVLTLNLNDENGETLSSLETEIPQYKEVHYTWDKTTGEDAIQLFQMVYSYYKSGKLINVDLKDGNKMYKLTNISQPNSMGTQFWCQFRTLDWYTDNVDMVFLQTINAVLEVNGGIVQSVEVRESINQFALVREYNGSKGALPVDNTKEYIPTSDYEPATKQYVDISHYKRMPGWSSQRNQVLKNINGIPTWVNE